MIYRHVFVVRPVLETIRDEARRARYRETGGPLVGYISEDRALVVTHASGPGPRAQLRFSSVLIDGVHAQTFCDAVHRESQGRLDYVGDWHRHPGWSLRPSDLDATAMRKIAAFEYCPVRNPISLIYRSLHEAFIVYTLNHEGELAVIPSSLMPTIVL